MDDLLRKEIVGDWNNLKGTEYHLVYALWLLVRQRVPRVEFYRGNDLLVTAPPQLAEPYDEVVPVRVCSAEQDIWVQVLPSVRKGDKRVLALEVMFNNSPIAAAIRFGKIESIDNNILSGRSDGMVTLDESVRRLLGEGRIRREVAEHFVSSVDRLS